MKKLLSSVLATVMLLAVLAGCSNGTSDSTPTAAPTQAPATEQPSEAPATEQPSEEPLSGTVNLDGSTSMESVIQILIESFNLDNPDVTLNYTASGSGSGITAAIDGTVDMGLSSRELTEEETSSGAVPNVIALDGVAIIVHPDNPVSDLTVEQIAQLFTGEITNWSELGGNDAPVAALGREPGSGTRGAFEEIVGVEDACAYASEYSSTGDVIGNVANNPNAIGYASLSAVDDSVKALKVAGVDCTEDTVKDGSYAIQRPFLIVTKDGTELSPAAQAFLDYAMSADVAGLIAQAGAVSPN